VTVNGSTVVRGATVSSGDNTLYFESTSGVLLVIQGLPNPAVLRFPRINRVLGHMQLPPASVALLPASLCFSTPIISTLLHFLFAMPPPANPGFWAAGQCKSMPPLDLACFPIG
jgi:hypothetical protein